MQSHGGYRKLKSYQTATIIYDLTVEFVKKYLDPRSRTCDQMIQAARSGRQNIAEGSQASGTSKKTELRLVGVARASLEELLVDYEDYLRQRGIRVWDKNDPQAITIRNLTYKTDKSYSTYQSYLSNPDLGANTIICLIHQASYLLDQQLRSLEKAFVEEGGYSEQLLKQRLAYRKKQGY